MGIQFQRVGTLVLIKTPSYKKSVTKIGFIKKL